MGIIKFKGFKNEDVIKTWHDGRIIRVRPGDPKSHWTKVEEVMTVVDEQLGIKSNLLIRNKEKSQVFLYVSLNPKRIVGVLLAETLSESDSESEKEKEKYII